MKKILSLVSIIAIGLICTLPVPAMAQEKRLSPHDTISTVVSGGRVMIVYGRPYTTKPGTDVARKIWGGLIPYGKVWRMGADEATLLITQKALNIGGATVPAGAYTLFLLPQEDGTAKLIISKDVGQWGEEYTEADDFARVDLTKTTLDTPVNEFTMAITKTAGGGGVIKLSWENTEYSISFTPAP
jgi:hypothetical protein